MKHVLITQVLVLIRPNDNNSIQTHLQHEHFYWLFTYCPQNLLLMHCRILMPNPDLLLSLFLSQPSSTTFTLFFSVQPSSINFSFLVSTHYFNFSYLFLSQPSSVYFNCPKPSCIIFTVPNLAVTFSPSQPSSITFTLLFQSQTSFITFTRSVSL